MTESGPRLTVLRPLRFVPYALAVLWTLVTLLPLIWMYYTSLKSLPAFNLERWLPPTDLQWVNYLYAWTGSVPSGSDFRAGSVVAVPFASYFRNSIIVTAGSLAATMLIASLGAYALARHRVFGVRMVAALIVVGLAIPTHALILPIWFVEDKIGLINTHLGLILAYVGTSLPFALLLLTSYFRSFPSELEDAARVDGCSNLGVLRRVVIPMSKGPLAAVGILLANGYWNEFLYALILMPGNEMKTLPVGVFQYAGQHFTPYTVLLAALGIATAPLLLLYLIFQRQITNLDVELIR